MHDPAFDSEYRERNVIGWFQGNAAITDNISFYARHESMPYFAESETERGGYGVNQIGIMGAIQIGK